MSYIKTKLLLITSSLDQTIKFWKIDDFFFSQKTYGIKLIQTVSVVERVKSPYKFFINCIAFRGIEKIEIFCGDTEGEVHCYELVELDTKEKLLVKFIKQFVLHKPTVQKTTKTTKLYNVHKMTIQKV